MTIEQVRERVEAIRQRAGDFEMAHVAEDELWRDVLRAIADGQCDDPAALAREALESEKIDFAHWYA